MDYNIIIAFFIAQLVNVILSTLKSVITIKGGKNWAALANAISYGFNTIVIKSLVDVDLSIAIAITIITNLVGVYFGLGIMENMRKDQLWKITVTIPSEQLQDFTTQLQLHDISFITYETQVAKYKVVDIFSKTRNDSKLVKSVFKYFKVKYTINANSGTL